MHSFQLVSGLSRTMDFNCQMISLDIIFLQHFSVYWRLSLLAGGAVSASFLEPSNVNYNYAQNNVQ